MNCEEFEMLMADALGDELSPNDRPVFEAHLAECDCCRQEYESARVTVATMRSLPGAKRVSVRREGSRLVIEDPQRASATVSVATRKLRFAPRAAGGVFRYAAGLLIAFICGYGLHVGLTVANTARQSPRIVQTDGDNRTAAETEPVNSFQSALANTYVRNPARSDLAKCLLAMSHTRH